MTELEEIAVEDEAELRERCRRLIQERNEARTIACKLLYIAECRGPRVWGPRPPWLEANPDG